MEIRTANMTVEVDAVVFVAAHTDAPVERRHKQGRSREGVSGTEVSTNKSLNWTFVGVDAAACLTNHANEPVQGFFVTWQPF